jgi:hypothetical protein
MGETLSASSSQRALPHLAVVYAADRGMIVAGYQFTVMAEVMQDATLRQRIEFALSYLLRRWQAIPDDAADWDMWDNVDKEVYQLEWAIPKSHLAELESLVQQGLLNAAQPEQYDKLVTLIKENQPILEETFAA